MAERIPQDLIAAASSYEALMVPALFGDWAARVAEAAKIEAGDRVLDVACGTGVLARTVARLPLAAGSVAGVDPAPGMLEVAREVEPAVDWRRGVAESLPVEDEGFEVVVSQFGLMFFEDRPAALREMLRVLKPGGRLAIAVWDSLERNPAYRDEAALVERIAGAAAADAIRAPFVLGDRDELGHLFVAAGVAEVSVTTRKGQGRFPDVRTMVEADLRGWLPLMGINLSEERIQEVLREAEHALSPYIGGDGQACFETSAHIVTGTRRRPGS